MYIGRYVNNVYFITDETAFGPYYHDSNDEHVALAFDGWLYPIIPEGASVLDLTNTFAFSTTFLLSDFLAGTSVVNFGEGHLVNVYLSLSSLISELSDNTSCILTYSPILADIVDFGDFILTQDIFLLLSESFLSLADSLSLSYPLYLSALLTLADKVFIVIPVETFSIYPDFGDSSIPSVLTSVLSRIDFSESLSTAFLFRMSDILNLWSLLISTTDSYQTLSDSISLLDVFTFDSSLHSSIPILFMVDILDKKTQLFSVFDNPEVINQGFHLLTGSDGIYSCNLLDNASSTPVIVLNPSSLLQSRIKRLDKIYSNVPVKKAIIYTDTVYSFQGNGKWVTVPRGVKSDTYEIAVYPEGDVEFIEMDVILERRAK